jgi:enduracididine biosynthesis enzyme MppP
LSITTSAGSCFNLTEIEISALASAVNVADGHARFGLSASQQKIIGSLPELFHQAAETPADLLDADAHRAFLAGLGQHGALTGHEILSCYSSSVAMEILSRSLAASGRLSVALIHPTFDNIPDILKGVGARLRPVSEEQLSGGEPALPPGTDVLFITTPNNPTGWVLGPGQLAYWARQCARRDVILALDTSFRGFDQNAQYDHYDVLSRAGCRYVVVEDTGKLWPTLDLKAGYLVFPQREELPLRRIYTDILLGISPLVMLLVQLFAEDASEGGFAELRRFIRANRVVLREELASQDSLSCPDPASRVSVERVAVPASVTATQMWRDLSHSGVHMLPCSQFHWADPVAGERYVRIALGRPPEVIQAAAAAIRGYAECR